LSLIFEKTNNGIMVFKCSDCGVLVFNDNEHVCTAPRDTTEMKGTVGMGIQQTNGDEPTGLLGPNSETWKNVADKMATNMLDKTMLSCAMEKEFEWRKWSQQIPYLKFKQEWFVKITPPFMNAIIRFRVALTEKSEKSVSVYLDCYDMLGIMGEPYWEVYPYEGDVGRCAINQMDELFRMIDVGLKE